MAVAAAYLTVAVAVRYWPLTQGQRDAIALMEQPNPPVQGRDGSDLAWLQNHDVPPAERKAAAAALRVFLERHVDDPDVADRPDHPLRAYAALPAETWDGRTPCGHLSPCLAEVRARRVEAGALLEQQRRRVELGLEMSGFDGVRYGLSPSPDHPIQETTRNTRLARVQLAYQFLGGQQEFAISGVCRDLAGWRRIASDNDTLIGSLLSLAAVRNDALLLAEMIAELPRGQDLPAACRDALAPTTDAELNSCPMLRYEYRFARSVLAEPDQGANLAARVLNASIGDRHRDATLATRIAGFCGTSALAAARADRSLAPPYFRQACTNFRRWVDPVGCTFLEISSSDPVRLARYADRRTDVAAILAGLRTVAWLRAQHAPEAQWHQLLKSRPESLGLRREPVLSEDRSTLSIPLLNEWHGTTMEIAVKPRVTTSVTN